ncbi:MAG: hypothetical protein KIT09_21365 [Bryobacteraceae bacterium]|nr:hypothetical protein [Bryobacteraceae bacterium]
MSGRDAEFYVGYLPKAPGRLGASLRRIVLGLNLLAAAVALTLIFAQAPFADSRFEFLQYRDYEGVLVRDPYPSLLVKRPGAMDGVPSFARYLLVAEGKRGFVPGAELEARLVRLRGSLIHREDQRMVEVLPQSLTPAGGEPLPKLEWTGLGEAALYGEIVDTKCYLGVMNPGEGKVHRECAARCISGGVPPGLRVRDTEGNSFVVLLAGADGRPLNREVLDFVAEPVRIDGKLSRLGDTLILRAEPSTFYRLAGSRP